MAARTAFAPRFDCLEERVCLSTDPFSFAHDIRGSGMVMSADSSNESWTSTEGKYLTLRPRPVDPTDPSVIYIAASGGGSWGGLDPVGETLTDETPDAAIGLLLPAVQKVRMAAGRSMSELQGSMLIAKQKDMRPETDEMFARMGEADAGNSDKIILWVRDAGQNPMTSMEDALTGETPEQAILIGMLLPAIQKVR